jgi:hypothetical protein
MKSIHIQNICPNCLQWLVNNESQHTEQEKNKMNETLANWAKEKYYPLAPNFEGDFYESSFSHNHCDLCDCLPGERYEFNFIDKSKNNHKLNGFEFIPYEHEFRVFTLTKDSFSYPEKTWVATINDKQKRLRFCHGYFPDHKIGIKLKSYANKIGYSHNG